MGWQIIYKGIKPKTNVVATPAQSNASQGNIQLAVFDRTETKDTSDDLTVKHEYNLYEVKRKASNVKEMKKTDDALEAGGSTYYECTSRNEFEKDKENIFVEKEKMTMKNDIWSKEMKKNMIFKEK